MKQPMLTANAYDTHVEQLFDRIRQFHLLLVRARIPYRIEGILLAPVADLVRMKLTSYRLKDRVHIQDLDAVGLITPEIEAQLPELLRARLAEVRAAE